MNSTRERLNLAIMLLVLVLSVRSPLAYGLINYENDPNLAKAMEHDGETNKSDPVKSDRKKAEYYYLRYLEKAKDPVQRARVYCQLGSMYAVSYNREKGERIDRDKARQYYRKVMELVPERIDPAIIETRSMLVSLNHEPGFETLKARVEFYKWLDGFDEEKIKEKWLPLRPPAKPGEETRIVYKSEDASLVRRTHLPTDTSTPSATMLTGMKNLIRSVKQGMIYNAAGYDTISMGDPNQAWSYLLEHLPGDSLVERTVEKAIAKKRNRAAQVRLYNLSRERRGGGTWMGGLKHEDKTFEANLTFSSTKPVRKSQDVFVKYDPVAVNYYGRVLSKVIRDHGKGNTWDDEYSHSSKQSSESTRSFGRPGRSVLYYPRRTNEDRPSEGTIRKIVKVPYVELSYMLLHEVEYVDPAYKRPEYEVTLIKETSIGENTKRYECRIEQDNGYVRGATYEIEATDGVKILSGKITREDGSVAAKVKNSNHFKRNGMWVARDVEFTAYARNGNLHDDAKVHIKDISFGKIYKDEEFIIRPEKGNSVHNGFTGHNLIYAHEGHEDETKALLNELFKPKDVQDKPVLEGSSNGGEEKLGL